jgi:membrane associated rhomboid family serine protease
MSYQRFRPTSQNRMPPGVLNLIIINVILFVAKLFAERSGIDFDRFLDLHHPFHPDFHFFQYITSMFMHGDFTHILFNMFGLWVFGAMVENAYGTKRFIIFYLICGLGASLIYQLWESIQIVNTYGGGFIETLKAHPEGELLGASGAVFGVMMGAAMLFPNTQMMMMFIPAPIKLKWLVLFYGAAEFYSAWQSNPDDHVAHIAHLGGIIFGFILVKIYSRNKTHFY